MISTLSVSLDRYREFVDHRMSYIGCHIFYESYDQQLGPIQQENWSMVQKIGGKLNSNVVLLGMVQFSDKIGPGEEFTGP